jgi:hypothetical protein
MNNRISLTDKDYKDIKKVIFKMEHEGNYPYKCSEDYLLLTELVRYVSTSKDRFIKLQSIIQSYG